MGNRTVGRRVVRAPKRSMFWQGAQVGVTVATGASVAQEIVSEAILEGVPNPTLVRTRGELLLQVSATGATLTNGVIGLGLIVVNAAAFAAGVTSLPSPMTEAGSDWLWHHIAAFGTTAAFANPYDQAIGNVVDRVRLDGKAMRKVDSNQLVVLVVENLAQTSTITVVINGFIRVLFKK